MQLIRSKRKTVAIIIRPDGSLVVRAPIRTSFSYIENFLQRKREWIEQKTKEVLVKASQTTKPKQFVDGEEFLYLGEKFFLEVGKYKEIVLAEGHRIHFPEKFLKNPRKKMLEFYYKKTLEVISQLCQVHSQETGWKYSGIKIINAKTKWGSCNHANELRFNWKLGMAPLSVIEYVVVHELAHIPEKNHSPRFWSKVENILPDYRTRMSWLKHHGHNLNF